MAIEFTRYHLPNGRKTQEQFPSTPEIEALAQRFIDSGGKFECEVLRTGLVSLSACHEVDGEPQDIAMELCNNDASVVRAVIALVVSANKWLEANHGRSKGNATANRCESTAK